MFDPFWSRFRSKEFLDRLGSLCTRNQPQRYHLDPCRDVLTSTSDDHVDLGDDDDQRDGDYDDDEIVNPKMLRPRRWKL